MALAKSQPQNIRVVTGNGVAVYIDKNGVIQLKDINGKTAPLSDFISTTDQDNVARVIQVVPSNLSGEGTLEDQIVEYVNSLNYNKTDTDTEVWIQYSDTENLTAFLASTNVADACPVPDLSPYDRTLYHDGAGAFPVIGDSVFLDSSGLNPLLTPSGADVQVPDLSYIRTDLSGVMIQINCK